MMDLRLTKRVGRIPVHVDEEQEATESIDVDRLAIVGQKFDLSTACQFDIVFGGMDSRGRWHEDLSRRDDAAHIVITRNEKSAKEFDALFRDENGNPRTDFPQSWYESITETLLIGAAYQLYFGKKYPDIEVSLNGKVIFPPTKKT